MITAVCRQCAITRVVGCSAAKAATENLTRWLAVEFARQVAWWPAERIARQNA